ncbi:MAG: Ig-like domain-containing protein [Lachnospiraceae bacterium]|nr:Ig-like domain-containing protein [Lachnospiraceae bacterium]
MGNNHSNNNRKKSHFRLWYRNVAFLTGFVLLFTMAFSPVTVTANKDVAEDAQFEIVPVQDEIDDLAPADVEDEEDADVEDEDEDDSEDADDENPEDAEDEDDSEDADDEEPEDTDDGDEYVEDEDEDEDEDIDDGSKFIEEEEDEIVLVPWDDPNYKVNDYLPVTDSEIMRKDTYVEGEIPVYGLPSSYDSRSAGRVTTVKDQNPYGACWSFSCMASMESSMLGKGKNLDLSEMHLVRYARQNPGDPLGGTNDDVISTSGSVTDWLDYGGNVMLDHHALTAWRGAALESYNKYPQNPGVNTIDDAFNHDAVHLQNFIYLHTSWDSGNAVKQAIMTYGGIATSVGMYSNTINEQTWAMYVPGSGSNHAVTIVGWDDNYPRSNFGPNYYPSGNGAWLIKNSWGTNWGLDGYFWVSYEDKTISDTYSFVMDADVASTYDHNYQYDASQIDTSCTTYGKVANVFTVKGNKNQELKAVAMDFDYSNQNYSVQIYKDLKDASNPESGTPCLSSPVTGKTGYFGYYTVKLPKAVTLKPGQTFAVVYTVTPTSGSSTSVCAERSYSGLWDVITYKASSKAGQSFYTNSSGSWVDYGKSGNGNIRIKAFTKDAQAVAPSGIGVTPDKLNLEKGKSYTLKAKVVPENADQKVTWSSANTKIATVDSKGVVKAVAPGTVNITAKTVNGLTSKCVVKVIVNPSSIKLDKTKATMYLNKTKTLTLKATLAPTDVTEKTITWTVSDPKLAKVSAKGEVTMFKPGIVTITATTTNKKSAKCVITALSDNNSKNIFADVEYNTWQYKAAIYVYNKGVMTGKGEMGSTGRIIFDPNTGLKREEFTQILYAKEGKPSVKYTSTFDDVPKGQWYTNGVLFCYNKGIVGGVGDGSSFGTGQGVQRQQLCLMLYKYAKYKKYDTKTKISGKPTINDFKDKGKVASWAKDAVNWALCHGVMSGTSDGYLNPENTATRVETATIIKSFDTNVVKK